MPSRDVCICSRVSFSSIKPKALLISSVISIEVRGFSLAKISASMWGMMFPISICKVLRAAAFRERPVPFSNGATPLSGCLRPLLALQCGGTTDDLGELGSDGGLTCTVVGKTQGLEQLVGVVAGLVHGGHTGAVLRGVGI